MRHRPRFRRSATNKAERPYVDPNRPGSPAYSERHRRRVWQPMPGITRVDIGEG